MAIVRGAARRCTSGGAYVLGTTYTRFGEPTLVGTDGPDASGYDLLTHYEEGTRRVKNIVVSKPTAPSGIADLNYTYDDAGNITRVADLTPAPDDDTQCFDYDHLRRLTEAWTPRSGDCTAAKSVPALGGPAPYWQSWEFDPVGNRRTQVDHGQAETSRTYTYPAAKADQPHTLSTVVTTGAATATHNYTYDNTGNTTCRPTGPGSNDCVTGAGSQRLTWNPEGRLAKTAEPGGDTEYVYDADGNRLIRRDPAGSTLYLPGQELRFTKAGGVKSTTRYYTHNGVTIASRTPAGLTFLAGDHQNTSMFSFPATGTTQPVTVRRQTPYGSVRGPATAWPNTRGFVGGTVDNTGLTHLGAREYDPAVGRFISVDPVMDLTSPQQMHGYSYANGSPITLSDPTGLIPADCREFDCYGYDPNKGCPHGCGTPKNQDWGKKNGQTGSAPTRGKNKGGSSETRWRGDSNRVKREVAARYGDRDWDTLTTDVAPTVQEWMYQEYEEEMCELHPTDCLAIGAELAASGVWVVRTKGLASPNSSSLLVRDAAMQAMANYSTPEELMRANLSRAERALIPAKGAYMTRILYGTALHRATANALEGLAPNRFTYRASRGVDFLDRVHGREVELTTAKGVPGHVARGGSYVTASYVAYEVSMRLGVR